MIARQWGRPPRRSRCELACLALALACACGGAEEERKPDGKQIHPLAVPAKPEEAKPVVVAAPKEQPKEETKKVEPKKADNETKEKLAEKIDDENWLPREGAARQAFDRAVETARTDPGGAVSKFVEAASKNPYFYAAWFNAGASAEAAGDLANAERHYRTCLTVRPDYGPAIANLALLLVRTGRAADAQKLVDDSVRKAPDKAGPHLGAATLAWSKRDGATAQSEAFAALKLDERNVPSMRVMAAQFRAQGRLDTAKFALENALAVEPGNALLHLELGHVLVEQAAAARDAAEVQANEKLALVAYEKAARLRPDLAEAQENYGVLLLKQGFPQEAVKAFESAARLQPKSGRAQLHLGNGYRAIKSYDRAEQAYKRALELDKAVVDAHFNLGVLYIDNPVPGLEELARWQKAVVELRAYREQAKPEGALAARIDDYLDATDKRILKEIKRREREERRKKEDAPPAPAPAAAGAPPAAAGGSNAPK